jgi:hypothetical protein
MASGPTYDIRHPEMIAVGRSTVHVFTWMADGVDEPKQHEHEVSIMLIESIEPLAAAAKADPQQN